MNQKPVKSLLKRLHLLPSTPDPDAAYRSRSTEVSALFAYYSLGHGVLNTGSTTSDGLRHSTYMTAPIQQDGTVAYVEQAAVICVLDLPFNTQAHLLGVSRTTDIDRAQFENYLASIGMAKITLDEGFSAMCNMYTGHEHEFKVRYALDPDALKFVTRYCGNHLWELHDSELYVLVPQNAIGDARLLFESSSFIQAIRPALPAGNPDAPITHRELPFDMYDGPELRCPICMKHMELRESCWFQCRNGHGMLVTDRQLERLRTDQFAQTIDVSAIVHHGPLTCPYCHYQMESTRYKGSALEINACSNCQFSWIDTDDKSGLSGLSIGRDFSGD